MAETTTPNLDLILMQVGAPNREILHNDLSWIVDTITSGVLTLDLSGAGDYTLTDTLQGEAKQGSLLLTGVLTGDRAVLVPDKPRQYLVHNGCTGAFALTVKTVSGGGVTIGADTWAFLISDGTNVMATVTGGGGGTLPSASETQAGIIELATSTEVQTGTDTTRAVTPAGLSSRVAAETVSGMVELATSTEVQTGTDTTRAVTAAGLSSRTATETRTGLLELATTAEVTTATNDLAAVTPLKLQQRLTDVLPGASTTTQAGLVELATSAETTTGTDATRAVTPAGLAAKVPSGTALSVARYQGDGSGVESTPTLTTLTTGELGVGGAPVASTPLAVTGEVLVQTGTVTVQRSDGQSPRLQAHAIGTAIPVVSGQKTLGTPEAPLPVGVGVVCRVQAEGWNTEALVSGGRIDFVATETWSTTARGMRVGLFVTPAGSTTIAERVRVSSTGFVGVAGAAEPTAPLDIQGDTLRLRTARTPASATAAGNAGDVCWDASGWLYLCVSANTWRRIQLLTW